MVEVFNDQQCTPALSYVSCLFAEGMTPLVLAGRWTTLTHASTHMHMLAHTYTC